MKKIILAILVFGTVFKFMVVADGHFLFHMDSARDMVDVREMVVLKKPRLIGPTTAIDGLFGGPAWYYLLSIPFIISKGDPYAPLVMQIILWGLGGYFLLNLVSRWSKMLVLPIGFLWIASDFINLATYYAFNPNPVIFLTPLFIFLFAKYLENKKTIFGILVFALAGLFFNFEMSFGIFLPAIMLMSIFIKDATIFKKKSFVIGVGLFTIFILPQIIFNFKHEQLMLNALTGHIGREAGKIQFIPRFENIFYGFYNLSIPVFLNRNFLTPLFLLFSLPVFIQFFKSSRKDTFVLISLLLLLIPFIGYLFLPVTISPWHLGGEMVALIILGAFILKELWNFNLLGKAVSFAIGFFILYFSLANIFNFFFVDMGKPSSNTALYKNEIAAIDYVYKYADGKNFKVYTYLPSVYDYPYQYLIWWYGQKTYGYLPVDYAYAPNKPSYIGSKESFSATEESNKERPNSNLVFLIKEPDRNYTRPGWEGEFVKLKSLGKEMVGPIEVEIKEEKVN